MSGPAGALAGERYRIERLLGEGGMGSVYQAYDRLTGQRVALKLVRVQPEAVQRSARKPPRPVIGETMPLSMGDISLPAPRSREASRANPQETALAQTLAGPDPSLQPPLSGRVHVATTDPPPRNTTNALWARLSLTREFRTLASIRHPHIISVLDYGFGPAGQPFFTMELLEQAKTLSSASRGRSKPEVGALLAQLLQALSYLHRRGILHRDLKPGNVLVVQDREGLQLKLLDFGLSLSRAQERHKSGELTGTLAYMPPELFRGLAPSEATDLFAFGVIAYELLVGRHPFDRGDEGDLISAILTRDPDLSAFDGDPAMQSLLRRLLAKSPALRMTADDALAALAQAMDLPPLRETIAVRESTLQAARLVGREQPLAVLRSALDVARTGSGATILLAGESGVGKSRLMEELRVHCLVQGLRCIRGQAKSEGGDAYGVFRDILRALCLTTPLGAFEQSVLKAILPDLESLLERPIPDAPNLSPLAAQLRIVRVIESLILRQEDPLLLLLEDIHWIDPEGLTVLRLLTTQCKRRPLLIVASYRDDERPAMPRELAAATVLKLARLSDDGIRELCQAMLGNDSWTNELVEFLGAETEGNPFFIVEVLRALAEEAGQLSGVGAARLSKGVVTGGITAMVRRRLDRLPADARPLLELTAVAGRQLDLKLLRGIEPQLDTWLYLAASAAVLEVSDHAWCFAHDKIRESLLAELSAADKIRLHVQIARAMAAAYPDSPEHAAALADHYERGSSPAEAAPYLVSAGLYALQQGAAALATDLLGAALDAQHLGFLSRGQRAQAYGGLISAQLALGKVRNCQATYAQLGQDLHFALPSGVFSIARAGLSTWQRMTFGERWQRLRQGKPANAVAAADGVPPEAATLDSDGSSTLDTEEHLIYSAVAEATRRVTESMLWDGQVLRASAAVIRGLDFAEALDDAGMAAYFMATASFIASMVPLRSLSGSLLDSARQLHAARHPKRFESDYWRLSCVACMNHADWQGAHGFITQGLAHARAVGDEQTLLFLLAQKLIRAFRLGLTEEFEAAGSEVYERARRSQNMLMLRTYPLYRGIAALREGDAERAWPPLCEAEQCVQASQDLLGRILLGGVLALCALRRGQQAEALQRATQTLELAWTFRYPSMAMGEGLSSMAEVFFETWISPPVPPMAQHSRALLRALISMQRCAQLFPASAPRTWLLHARLASRLGSPRIAIQLGRISLAHARKLKLPYEQTVAAEWLQHFSPTPAATR